MGAIAHAASLGSIVVMAAGNEGEAQPGYPASHAIDWGLSVGAVDNTRAIASFSNRAGSAALNGLEAHLVDDLVGEVGALAV